MSNRNEFDRKTKVQIIKRSMINGTPTCERIEDSSGHGFVGGIRCGCTKGLEVNHKAMDAMKTKKRKLTVDDGENICKAHHRIETSGQMAMLANTLRMEAKHLGADKPNKAKIARPPKARRSTFKTDQIREMRERQYRKMVTE